MTVVQVGTGAAGVGPVGLMAGGVVGHTAGCGRLALGAVRRSSAAFRGLTRRALRAAASRYRRFPILSTPSGLLNHLGIYFPVILLSAFYGPRYAGLFALTQRAINVPLVLVGTSVGRPTWGRPRRSRASARRRCCASSTRPPSASRCSPPHRWPSECSSRPRCSRSSSGGDGGRRRASVQVLAPMPCSSSSRCRSLRR